MSYSHSIKRMANILQIVYICLNKMELYLIRHTSVEVDNKEICYGHSEVALNKTYVSEAEAIIDKLPTNIDCFACSGSNRAIKLANYFKYYYFRDEVVPLLVDDRLKEMNFGDWEMKAWNAVNQDDLNKWMNSFVSEKVPGGESFEMVLERVRAFLFYLKIHPLLKGKEKMAIVAHSGSIRAMLCHLNKIPLEKAFTDLKVDYGSIHKVKIDLL
jgi:alpha-ribazole phosphatase